MENLLGLAGSGAGILIVFVLYVGGASVFIKLVDRLMPRKYGR